MMFKGMKVYISFDDQDQMLTAGNLATMKYQLDQNQEYKVNPNNISEIDPAKLKRKKALKPSREAISTPPSLEEERTIFVYTDGACTGNPGPAGIGIFFRRGKREREISRYIGQATNNIAELTAIKVALQEINQPEAPVRLFTDSSYCCGILSRNWKPTRNLQLIKGTKEEMKRFLDLKIIKVKGHAGHEENERVDILARKAITENIGID